MIVFEKILDLAGPIQTQKILVILWTRNQGEADRCFPIAKRALEPLEKGDWRLGFTTIRSLVLGLHFFSAYLGQSSSVTTSLLLFTGTPVWSAS